MDEHIQVKNVKKKSGRNVAFMTLGCKVNQYETEIIRQQFKKDVNYEEVSLVEKAAYDKAIKTLKEMLHHSCKVGTACFQCKMAFKSLEELGEL